MPDFILETPRLQLRPYVEADVPALAALISSGIIKTMLGSCRTAEDQLAIARDWLVAPHEEKGAMSTWLVTARDGAIARPGAALGVVASEPTKRGHGGADIHYLIDQNLWGKGVGREAVGALCDYLFRTLALPCIDAGVFAELNPGSAALARSLGMTEVGRTGLVGVFIDEAWAVQTQDFDIWRVEQAVPETAAATLQEAAFKIGQVLGDGTGEEEALKARLLKAATDAGLDAEVAKAIIDQRLSAGLALPGMTLFRVDRDTYLKR